MGATMTTATGTGNTLADQFLTKYNKDLLKRAIQLTVLDQFATKMPFPKNAGAKVIRFFRQKAGGVETTAGTGDYVSTITEGTLLATLSDIGLDYVEATMVQYGQRYNISDVLGLTELFSTLMGVKSRIAEEAALHADTIVRNKICGSGTAGATANTAFLNRMYAQGAATFAALNSAALAASVLTIQDVLRVMTQLQINRAPKKNGKYYMIVPPQIAYDMMLDVKYFIPVGTYQDKSAIVKGEVGTWWGVAIVIATNPFLQNTAGTEGTYSTAGTRGYCSIGVGMDAYGVPQMEGQSEYSPRVQIIDTPDKYDALNQWTVVAWKSYWATLTLNNTYGINITSKSAFA